MTQPAILVCPNAFKGSLTASEASHAMAEGVKEVLGDAVPLVLLPLADGGDGTLETLVEATGGTIYRAWVHDPLYRPVEASWGRLGGEKKEFAVIEMAKASGLCLLKPEERDPLHATTYGTGELMLEAVRAGCKKLLIGIGGSATNDGGAGMAQALGARLLDEEGKELPFGGAALRRLRTIDISHWKLPPDVEVIVACDVDNPLCGKQGASAVYGPQKGATAEMVAVLDAALAHYATILQSELGVAVADVPGAGAAGGLGAGLLAFCRAKLVAGADMVLDVLDFEAHCRNSWMVLTGEGKLDEQTLHGKAVLRVARRAARLGLGIPVVALGGAVEAEAEEALFAEGVHAVLPIVERACTLEEAMSQAYPLLKRATRRALRWVLIGQKGLPTCQVRGPLSSN
ncbi:glycerate kinase family protein [Chthonomonas calidirosea]|uniref:glycerate kinase family protein n=1 Tax=Chthonomonas calidirosea TaxID=454171 RepID=UPI000A587AE6|nr:glycerate kinase [Chthonomonas calidirosea]